MGSFYGSWVNNKKRTKYGYIIPLILCVISAVLILMGGDFGSAAIMCALYALVFMSIPVKEKTMSILKVVACVCLVGAIGILKFSYLIVPQDVLESNYRLNRFIYKNPCDRYEEDSGYQVCNGFIAIDNGGLSGTGIGKSVQKYLYLPASHTDFIFPIVVEEMGVITGCAIIIGYMVLIFFVFKVATRCTKLQNSIICYGIAIYFMLHIFVNLGGVLGVIPLTGVPLPFLSYGGSFCITILCSFAVIQRINIENEIERSNN
jgi:cell division protein FtsW